MSERILEIRTYRLKPGTAAQFHQVVVDEARPLLAEFGLDVVRTGPSEDDEDGVEEYVLIRAFDSLADRDEKERAFYGSQRWLDGPRKGIMSRLETYHTIVLTVPESAIEGLRD